jgi:hypothetical protein
MFPYLRVVYDGLALYADEEVLVDDKTVTLEVFQAVVGDG